MATSPADSAPELLTPTELAERYRIPTATAAKWRWNGSGPAFVKFGTRVLYRQSDVESWITSNLKTSTSANHQ